MKKRYRNQMKKLIAMLLVCAILTGLIPASLPETVHAAAVSAAEQEKWYDITAKINSSWGRHIAGEITLTNNREEAIQDWQIEFPWDAQITSLWGANYEPAENGYIITPADDKRNLAAGASVSIGFMAEGEDSILEELIAEGFFENHGVHITTAEERENMPLEPSREPAPAPTLEATASPTVEPTASPTIEPIATPTLEPTATLTLAPTPMASPTLEPTATPTLEPTASPTVAPTVIPAASPTLEPTATPTLAKTAIPTLKPTVSLMLAPTASPTATPTLVPTASPTIAPKATPTLEPTAVLSEEPTAEDFYVYTDTTLTEDLTCRNLFLMGGALTVNGCTITVQGDYFQNGKNCSQQNATINILGNAHIVAGALTAKEQSVFRVDGTMDVRGNSLSFTKSELIIQKDFTCNTAASNSFSNSSLQIAGNVITENGELNFASGSQVTVGGDLQAYGTGWFYINGSATKIDLAGNFVIDSQKQSKLLAGSLTLGGDLIQTENSAENSLRTNDPFQLIFRAERRQKISLAYPETVTLGTMDFRESAGMDVPDEIHGKDIYGFAKMCWKEKLDLYLSSIILKQDEKILCDHINLYGSSLNIGKYQLTADGNINLSLSSFSASGGRFQVEGDCLCDVQRDFSLSKAEMQIAGNLTAENGRLYFTSGNQVVIGGDLRLTDTGWFFINGSTKIEVVGDFVIDSQKQSSLSGGSMTLGGDLIQTENSAENSLKIIDSFQLIFRAERRQKISLAYPSAATLGTLDFRESAGMDVPDEIHGKDIYGFAKMGRKGKLDLYLSSIVLKQDERILCDHVNMYGSSLNIGKYQLIADGNIKLSLGSFSASGGRFQVEGDCLCDVQRDFSLSKAEMQIAGNLTAENGRLYFTSGNQVVIGGNLRLTDTGWFFINGSTKIEVAGDFVIDSQKQSSLSNGSMILGGDLIQTENSAENSLKIIDSFQLIFRAKKRQKISLAYPSAATLGTLDFRESAGMDVPDEIHGKEIYGFAKMGRKEKLDLYLSSIVLKQDERILCGNVNLYEGSLNIGKYQLTAEGNIHLSLGSFSASGGRFQVEGNCYCDVKGDFSLSNAEMQVMGNLTAENGKLYFKSGSRMVVGGDFLVTDTGWFFIWETTKIEVAGDFIIDSQKQSSLSNASMTLGGDLIQTENSAEDSLKLTGDFNLILNGTNTQTIDLPYIDTIPYLNLTDSAGVHLEQEFQGYRLDGVENIILDGDTLYTEYNEVYVGHDGVIDGNYRCYGRLDTNEHNLKVKGDYHQYGTINVNQGSMEITGNYTAHKSTLEMRGEKFHVHGNVKIGKEAAVNMYGGQDAVFLVDGDYVSSSRSRLIQRGTSGVLELKGDLIQNESAYSIGMDATNMTIIFSGSKTQKSTVPHVFGEVACIDMSNAVKVDFGEAMLQARQIKGLSQIKNNVGIALWKSRVVLEQDETVKGELMLCDTYLDCNDYQLRVTGSLEQSGGMVKLNHGRLHTDGCYSIMGNGILQMIQADDVLRVDEDFTTESTMSHATMLTNGRMELGGKFDQSGHAASFGSSGKFTIAFMGSGEHEAHFDNIEYSRFANIDVAHANVVMKDEKLIATGRLLFCIGKGFVSGLQEALATEGLNATAIAFTTAAGIAITAGMAVLPAAIVAIISTVAALLSIISASFMAAQAVEGIYNTATGTGTSYQKAEAYAHDAALLLMSIEEIVESGKDILNNLKHLDFIFAGLKGRKTRVDADELGHSVETKTVKTLYSFDDFVDCMQDYLDADSLWYVKQELGKDSDNLSLLNKVAEAIQESSRSIGDAKLNKTDIAFGLDKLHESGSVDDAVQTMVRCSKAKLNRYGNFYEVLEQQGITLDQFDKLKQQNAGGLEPHEIKTMRAIRESIPNPTSETLLRKTIPVEDIEKYIGEGGRNTIQGYVARDGDVSHIEGYKNVRKSLCLDYKYNGVEPFPEDGNAYGYIKFHTADTGRLKIAFGKKMGGYEYGWGTLYREWFSGIN